MQDLDYFCPTKLFKCIEDQAWSVVLRRLERTPEEAQVWIVRRAFDNSIVWRRLPIHEALIHSAPIVVVEALLNAYPSSTKEKDSSHRLAIHYACLHQASVDVIKGLLKAYPDGAIEKDSSKRLAIHYAYQNNASFDVIKQLLIAYPACLDEQDESGNTPGIYLENLENTFSLFSTDNGEGSLSHETMDISASYIMIQILKQALTDNDDLLSMSRRTEEIATKEYQQLRTSVDELTLIRLHLDSKVKMQEQELLKLKESNEQLLSKLASLNDSMSVQAAAFEVSVKASDELKLKLEETIKNSADLEKSLLAEKELEISRLKEHQLRELVSSQESHRKIFDDLNEEFNVYKETRSSQIDSLVAAQNLLMENLKAQESEINFLRDEVVKKNLEIKRNEDLHDKAHRRAETLTGKLKEAVDEIQKATNCILEERQTNAELELEMEIAVKSLEDLETRNQTLEEEATARGGELNSLHEENMKLSDQIKSIQDDLSHNLTELTNARDHSDDIQRQLYDVVEKCESAVNMLKDQQIIIDNFTSDLKAKDEKIMQLEDQIYDLKISYHVSQEDSMKKGKELQRVKEENAIFKDKIKDIQIDLSLKIAELENAHVQSDELHALKLENMKMKDQTKALQSELSFKTNELENAKYHSDNLQREMYEVVDKCENAIRIIKDHQNVINNLNNELKAKDDSIMLLKEHLYELKISHHNVQEDSVSLAKTLKLINLCLLSADSNEGRLRNVSRADIVEELAKTRVSDERLTIQGQQSITHENQSSRVSSPTNIKDFSFVRGDNVSKESNRTSIHRPLKTQSPRSDESRFDFDGDNAMKERSQLHTYSYSMRSPPSSPRSRSISQTSQQNVGLCHESVRELSRVIQDFRTDRRLLMDVEQANATM